MSQAGRRKLSRLRLRPLVIPIVFLVGVDPVQLGLVTSLNRPGGNLTGFNGFVGELGSKGLALLHDLVPSVQTIAFLENPNNPLFAVTTRDVLAAAPALGLKVQILNAGTDREIDAAFASLAQARTGALIVGVDPFFNNRIQRLVELAAAHAVPTLYSFREFVVVGGLISYGVSLIESYRQVGLYTGRILKGEKPSDLPFQSSGSKSDSRTKSWNRRAQAELGSPFTNCRRPDLTADRGRFGRAVERGQRV